MTNNERKHDALIARQKVINECVKLFAQVYYDYEDIFSYDEIIGPVPLDKFIAEAIPNVVRSAWGLYDSLKEGGENA